MSEAFLIAWRRRHVLPEPPLPWLLVTARNLIADSRRRYVPTVTGDAQLARLLSLAAQDSVGEADPDGKPTGVTWLTVLGAEVTTDPPA